MDWDTPMCSTLPVPSLARRLPRLALGNQEALTVSHAALFPSTVPTRMRRALVIALATLLALSGALGVAWVAPPSVEGRSSESYDNPVLAVTTDEDTSGAEGLDEGDEGNRDIQGV